MATLLAKENIRDVLYRYCRAADRGDLALLKSCYHPDSLDDHGFFKGSGWDFADYVLTVLSEIELSIHSISNPLIELHGKKAYVETQVSVVHRIKRAGQLTGLWHQGRYVDEFEEREGTWKILCRVFVLDAERFINSADFHSLVPANSPHRAYIGQRGKSDLVYRLKEIRSFIRPAYAMKRFWTAYRLLLWLPKPVIRWIGACLKMLGLLRG